MIGPQAYEELFQTSTHFSTKDLEIKHDGIRYTYYIMGWTDLFDSYDMFKAWCIEDVKDRQGMYADKIETVN